MRCCGGEFGIGGVRFNGQERTSTWDLSGELSQNRRSLVDWHFIQPDALGPAAAVKIRPAGVARVMHPVAIGVAGDDVAAAAVGDDGDWGGAQPAAAATRDRQQVLGSGTDAARKQGPVDPVEQFQPARCTPWWWRGRRIAHDRLVWWSARRPATSRVGMALQDGLRCWLPQRADNWSVSMRSTTLRNVPLNGWRAHGRCLNRAPVDVDRVARLT
jgi:hypothetical protein